MLRQKRKARNGKLRVWGSNGSDLEDETLLPSRKFSVTAAEKHREEVEKNRALEFES
jgi:hypothetical protein